MTPSVKIDLAPSPMTGRYQAQVIHDGGTAIGSFIDKNHALAWAAELIRDIDQRAENIAVLQSTGGML